LGLISLDDFAAAVGASDPVTVTGLGTRGGPVPGVRVVRAPAGVEWVQPDEMTVCCGAATPVDVLVAALAEHHQTVALPPGGTVGGALALGCSDVRRLGWGPVRDVLLQARYISAKGEVVKAGGPTVKNVSGFDLCRLLVGSRGTLGFLGEVILRTRPVARSSRWFTAAATDPFALFTALYRPTSVLWNGSRVWILLEGHPRDIVEQAAGAGLVASEGPPVLPTGGRWTIAPAAVGSLTGEFVAEVGVGVVHHVDPTPDAWVATERPARVVALARAVKRELDPTNRLNPGVDV
jgi:glycolate oxidase FAD binding subunit